MSKTDADSLLITDLKNIRWLTGFRGSNATVFYAAGELHFLTDRRYANVVADQVSNATIHVYPGGDVIDAIKNEGLLDEIETCALESKVVSLYQLASLQKAFPNVEFKNLESEFELARSLKDALELVLIKEAQELAERTFDQILGILKPGMSESEVAAEIVYSLLAEGAETVSFEPIVASGPNGANPHAKPSSRLLAAGDLVVIDFGCVLNGYCSDMTRTIGIGDIEDEQRMVHQTVLDAMRSAIDHVRDGRMAKDVDAVARDYISRRGYGRYFTHSTGHGLGLDIHESPRVSTLSNDRLQEGHVITIEPGIYIPEKFGVRIEDMVHVGRGGAEVLTNAQRELVTI